MERVGLRGYDRDALVDLRSRRASELSHTAIFRCTVGHELLTTILEGNLDESFTGLDSTIQHQVL